MKTELNYNPTLLELLNDCCAIFNKTQEEITGGCRKKKFYIVRCVFCYVAFFYTKYSIRDISQAVGYTNHTSAIHQRDLAVDLLDTNDDFFIKKFNFYKEHSAYFNGLKIIRYPHGYKESHNTA